MIRILFGKSVKLFEEWKALKKEEALEQEKNKAYIEECRQKAFVITRYLIDEIKMHTTVIRDFDKAVLVKGMFDEIVNAYRHDRIFTDNFMVEIDDVKKMFETTSLKEYLKEKNNEQSGEKKNPEKTEESNGSGGNVYRQLYQRTQ